MFPSYSSFYSYPGFGFDGYLGYDCWPYYWYPFAYDYYPAYVPDPVYGGSVPYVQASQSIQQSARQLRVTERYWLIALKNDKVLAVTDYWLEGSDLHCITRQGKESSIEYS